MRSLVATFGSEKGAWGKERDDKPVYVGVEGDTTIRGGTRPSIGRSYISMCKWLTDTTYRVGGYPQGWGKRRLPGPLQPLLQAGADVTLGIWPMPIGFRCDASLAPRSWVIRNHHPQRSNRFLAIYQHLPSTCLASANRSDRRFRLLHPLQSRYKIPRLAGAPGHPPSRHHPSLTPVPPHSIRLAMVLQLVEKTRVGRRYILRPGWLWISPRNPPICSSH